MSDPTSRLPNLYQLLAVSPLESDPHRIRAAMDRLLQADSDRNRKIAALAQKYLLDSQRKSIYDQQWKIHFEAPKATHSPTHSYDYSQLNELLPSGDPLASFDLANSIRSSNSQEPDPLLSAQETHRSPIVSLPRRRRSPKQPSILVGATLLIAGVGGLLVLGLILTRPTQKTNRELARNGTHDIISRSDDPADDPKPNDLPKPSRDNNLSAVAHPRPSGLPQPGQSQSIPEIEAAPVDVDAPMDMPMPNFDAVPPTTSPSPQPPPVTPAPAPSKTLPVVSSEAKLTAAEKQAWLVGMTEARQWIGQHKFEESEKRISELRAAAKMRLQLEQAERLHQVHSFVKDIRKEISDAINEMEAAENFKIGTSTIASFVEGNNSKIIVKVSGERREYSLEEMPIPMALALVDRKLDPLHATSLARKGAYIMVHPKNSTMLARGKQMLQEAATAGAISMELARFYEDDYSLAE